MCKRMKILYLLPSLKKESPISGILALIKYLDRDRCDITVASLDKMPKDNNSIIKELDTLNVKIKPLNIHGWLGLMKTRTARNFINEGHFDIVHSYGIRPDIISSMVGKKSISVSSVREIISYGYRLLYGTIISTIFSFVHTQALKKMDCIIAISNAIQNYLARKGLDVTKIRCIPNFVDLTWMNNAEYQNKEFENKSNSEIINVGYIGNLIPLKRVDWILKAIADLLKNHSDLKIFLHLVGDGSLSNRLKVMVSKLGMNGHVKFYGYLDNIAPIMKKLDLIVMASKFEGIPRILMEAMSVGKTCIGPRIGGVDELIENNVTGYLFDPHSYKDLVRKLENVVIKKRYLSPIKVKEHIENNFDARKGSKKTLELYESLVANRAI